MSDITGSVVVSGVTFSYDINPDTSNPSATVVVSYAGFKIGTVTLNKSQTSASVGGKEAGTEVKATITANWDSDTLTYSLTLDSPFSKKKTYSGTIVHW